MKTSLFPEAERRSIMVDHLLCAGSLEEDSSKGYL